MWSGVRCNRKTVSLIRQHAQSHSQETHTSRHPPPTNTLGRAHSRPQNCAHAGAKAHPQQDHIIPLKLSKSCWSVARMPSLPSLAPSIAPSASPPPRSSPPSMPSTRRPVPSTAGASRKKSRIGSRAKRSLRQPEYRKLNCTEKKIGRIGWSSRVTTPA